MSTESTIERDSLDSASITESESVGNIKNAEDMPTDYTKFAELCYKLKTIQKIVQTDKDFKTSNVNEILKCEERLDSYFFEISNSEDPKLNDVIALAESFLSMHYIKLPDNVTEREHLYIARFFVMQSMLLLEGKELHRNVILVAITTFNTLSNICDRLKNEEASLQYLNKALNLYLMYTKEQDDFVAPINILDSMIDIVIETNTVYTLNKLYMDTLKSLMILKYNFKHLPINMEEIATYMHKLLKKQLEDIPETVDYVIWSAEAIRLAQYFLLCNRFVECKNHLGLASVIITRFHNNFKSNPETETVKEKYCQYKTINLLITASWVKYGLALLFSSGKKLLNLRGQDNISKENNCKSKSTAQFVKQSTELLLFPYVEEEYEQFIHISKDTYITHNDGAKQIFVNILKLLNDIKNDKFIVENPAVRVETAQYVSKAYKYLALFEHEIVNQIKLQRRRIDVLEECLKTLNKKDSMIGYCIIWFELALINSTILNIRLETLKNNKLSEEQLTEINQLVDKSKTYLHLYIENCQVLEYALQNGMIDESYQTISLLNIRSPAIYLKDKII